MNNTTNTAADQSLMCGCCGRALKPGQPLKELEMASDGRWFKPGKVPEGVESQGVFDLGSYCYRKALKG
jgi:hypothetical protein